MVGGDSAEGGEEGGFKDRWTRWMDKKKGAENALMWVEPEGVVSGRSQWAEPVLVNDVQLCNFAVV